MFANTVQLRDAMIDLYGQIDKDEISSKKARLKLSAAGRIIDTIKIEIAAASLGRQFSGVAFSENGRVPALTEVKRIAG